MLSVEEVPASDAAARSATLGAAGAVLSIFTVGVALTAAGGPEFEVPSITEFAANRGIKLPSEQPEIVTEKDVPELALGENAHPEAVPEFEKSLEVKPLTFPAIVSVYVNETAFEFVGEVVVKLETPGPSETR